MCDADEFIDFSAHIELVLKSECNFRENFVLPPSWHNKNELL